MTLTCLRINISKTSAVWFGSKHASNIKLCQDLGLTQWESEFKLLGILFDNNMCKMERNFQIKLDEIRKVLGAWFNRFLTPYGKITLIKTLALSKTIFLTQVMTPSTEIIRAVETIQKDFLWNSALPKIKHGALKQLRFEIACFVTRTYIFRVRPRLCVHLGF